MRASCVTTQQPALFPFDLSQVAIPYNAYQKPTKFNTLEHAVQMT